MAKNREKAPAAFVEDLDAAFNLIEELPHTGEPVPRSRIRGLRRVLLGRVRYHLYYVVEEEDAVIEVLAIWHTSRGKRATPSKGSQLATATLSSR